MLKCGQLVTKVLKSEQTLVHEGRLVSPFLVTMVFPASPYCPSSDALPGEFDLAMQQGGLPVAVR